MPQKTELGVQAAIRKLRRGKVAIWRIARQLGVSSNTVQRYSTAKDPISFRCLKCGHEGHKKSYCKTALRDFLPIPGRKKQERQQRCTSCDQPGHKKNRCPNPVFVGEKNPAASAYARRHKAEGLCSSCPRPAAPGRTECEKCGNRQTSRA